MEKATITFDLDDGSEVVFEVLEETKINGVSYLLVVSDEDEALILREDNSDKDEVVYIPVEEEQELKAISKVFSELLDDVVFE